VRRDVGEPARRYTLPFAFAELGVLAGIGHIDGMRAQRRLELFEQASPTAVCSVHLVSVHTERSPARARCYGKSLCTSANTE
jgi:hypothetical protein